MAATSFTVQTSNPNEQLIYRLTANLAQLLKPLAQAPQQSPYQRQQNHGPLVYYHCGLIRYFSRDCNNSLLTINNNAFNQRLNHVNINFFGKDPLVEATSKSASQLEENLFYAFNIIDNDHDINELAINTSKLTKKKKKAKIDFVLNSNKASKSTANNNEPPKAKVFKNPSKLELSEIVQKSGLYFVVKDLIETLAHITFGQLITYPQFRKNLHKLLISKKKTPKTNKHSYQTELADNGNVTTLICKVQVAGYFIDLILDSRLSVSIIAKHFLEAIGKKIDESSIWPMTNIHSNKKKSLSIAKAVPVCINSINIETDMKVFKAKEYIIIVGNKWLKKVKALLDYKLYKFNSAAFFSTIDLTARFWQVKITKYGTYEFTVMFFSLTNALSFFNA
ncbi:hypothetical protein G9A89_015797 [Geosiphon pyriformis]|nr:hypothetical protein G9A89_015797 [Geosiphon pyriformis]